MMTTEATTPAAATPATPAAAAATTTQAAPAAAKETLFSSAPVAEAKPAEAAKTEPTAEEVAAAAIAKADAEATAWFYADGTPGKGAAPAWYLADKYKTVEEQAKAYPELQKRLGAFKGAPKDGKYEFTVPEGLPIEIDGSHPLVADFQKWAAENQLSAEGYQQVMGMFAAYEASQVPDLGQIKADIGENADARIQAVEQWARANLSNDEFNLMRESTGTAEAAKVFKVLEAIAAKTRQVALPGPGEDVMAANPQGQAGLRHLMEAKDKNGQLRYFTDEAYRKEVDDKTNAHFKATAPKA
jgi:hypothetical protein